MNRDGKRLFVTLTIVLSILVVLLSGYLIYDKVIAKEKKNDVVNNESKEENDSSKKIMYGHILDSEVGKFIVNKDGEVYYIPNDTWNKFGTKINLNFNEDNKKNLGLYGKYSVETYEMIGSESNEINAYKLGVSNINSAYEVYFGNGDINTSIIFIDNNGNISELYFKYNQALMIKMNKNIDDYKQIVSIVPNNQSGGNSAILIDREGNQYKYFGISN